MSLIKQITSQKLFYEELIKELKSSQLPIVFYGTSNAAKKFYTLFKDKEVIINSVIVSPPFYKKNRAFFEHPIMNAEELLEGTIEPLFKQKCNLLVFFGVDDVLLSKLKRSTLINKFYLIDGGVCFLSEFPYSYIRNNEKKFLNTYDQLEDKLSQKTMLGFIESRINGLADSIRDFCVPESYFPSNIIKLKDNEIYLDCGAFDGDTIKIFKEKMQVMNKNYQHIFAFEPDPYNSKKLQENCKEDKKITVINTGVYDKKTKLSFNENLGGGSSINEEGKTSILVDKIDNLVPKETPVTLIKMDLEGAELNALKGAEQTIKKHKPKLAIAVYHKIDDLIEIPKYIKQIVPNYKFYLRAQCYDTVDFTLFAIID